MAEIFASSFLIVVFNRLTSEEILSIASKLGTDAQLKQWIKTLKKLKAVLNDAEEKQYANDAVKEWLENLDDMAYDLDDTIDDLVAHSQSSSTSQVSDSFSTFKPYGDMQIRIDEISTRLEEISKEKDNLDLKENINIVGGIQFQPNAAWKRLSSSSLVGSGVYGREEDKLKIFEMLSNDEAIVGDKCVIPIRGMGGIGKTTLAQLLYNDKEVKSLFNSKAWVCVSDNFDVFDVTKKILESLTSQPCGLKDLDPLQVELQECLTGKRFLLVLDDVWEINYEEWDLLRRPFLAGTRGSKIIVTTRSEEVAKLISRVKTHDLKQLGNEHALSLLAQHALGKDNFEEHPDLREVGEKILKKCGGLPLAIKTLGGLLRTKKHQSQWEDILYSEIWDLSGGILPAIWLSYRYLPSHLKHCFSYCAIIPKDYEFTKNELVSLWMAVGLLPRSKGRNQMEDFGGKYFDDLLSRSFFQKATSNISKFVMHDLMNDLAASVAGAICFRLEVKLENTKNFKRARHSSYTRAECDVFKKFKDFYKVQNIRTFMSLRNQDGQPCYLSNKVLVDLLPKLKCLRVLSLSDYCIREVPDSIVELKHLRFLNLSRTLIKSLPTSVCTLYNLQTLLLCGCNSLSKLPADIENLINLRHLDNDCADLQEMPCRISKLTNLQTLSKFVVGKSNGLKLRELKHLMLRGSLSIGGLNYVSESQDAKEANLRLKHDIGALDLVWDKFFGEHVDGKLGYDVLDMLEPHRNLERLRIDQYPYLKFAGWLGDPSFSKITQVILKNCTSCGSLPPLGQLPQLKDLTIIGMSEVRRVGVEFYNDGRSSEIPFPSLESLFFMDMPKWEEWSFSGVGDADETPFPRLRELTIFKCPKLITIPLFLKFCRALESLNIYDSEMVTLWPNGFTPRNLVFLKQLDVRSCPQLISMGEEEQGLPCNLEVLTLVNCNNLEKLPNGLCNLASLKSLFIEGCSKLVSFPRSGVPPKLITLSIKNCGALETLPDYGANLCHLEHLIIKKCSSLQWWPVNKTPTTLRSLEISNCKNLESEGMEIQQQDNNRMAMSSLEYLEIYDNWRNFKTIVESVQNFANLFQLTISCCDGLEFLPERGWTASPKLRVLNISECNNFKSLPFNQNQRSLSSLEDLRISYSPKLESFPDGDLPPYLRTLLVLKCGELQKPLSEWGFLRLASLRSLVIFGGYPDLVSLSDDDQQPLLPPTLTLLAIGDLPNLESLSKGLQNLTSLEELYIDSCPKLRSLPNEDLLSNLSLLKIYECPILKQLCLPKDRGEYWPLIADIPEVMIDGRSIYDDDDEQSSAAP